MSRSVRALAALAAMAASFAAAFLLMQGRPRASLPPHVRDLVPPAAVAAPVAPATAVAEPPAPRDPDALASLEALAAEAEAREEALRAAVFSVPDSPELTLDDKLAHYRESLREGFAEMPGLDLVEQRGLFTEVFLRSPTVQQELAAMGAGERERALEHIRREMGFADEEIARLARADARREERWQNGFAYMEERRRLTATWEEGEVLDAELRHLRARHFGSAANTIEHEEARGFFRFERPRVYGRN